ncbi:uncharacterized protein BCR38DRAFT_325823, partial [Pseudomassariella vexata]
PLMSLPLEVRLQVHRWAHLMNDVKANKNPQRISGSRAHPSGTGLPQEMRVVPAWSSPAALVVLDKIPGAVTSKDKKPEPAQTDNLSAPYRPFCGLPTALLQINKQIYYECRELPFRENEFAFVNTLSSGLWSARSFMQGLERWQKQAVSFVRLEILLHDLTGEPATKWLELCEQWSSRLRGLRLVIASAEGEYTRPGSRGEASKVPAKSANGEAQMSIERGLKMLSHLEYLEVELRLVNWDGAMKRNWCKNLETTLN